MYVKESQNLQPIIDNVFSTVALCKKDIAENGKDNVINGTIGSLCDESGQLVSYHCFFDNYRQLEDKEYGAYAVGFAGNPDYNQAMIDWVIEDKIKQCTLLPVATMGGSGAISITFSSMLDANQTILLPSIAWESYTVMAQQNHFNIVEYENLSIDDMLDKAHTIMEQQHRLLLVINDPAHNPLGTSYTVNQWQQIIECLNELSLKGPVCLLNDIAYIDYCYDLNHNKDYMKLFDMINNRNFAIVIASSISKTATAYGLRLGCAIIVSKDEIFANELHLTFKKYCRSNWSNPNNSAMINFTWMIKHNKQAFLKEKQAYIDIIKKRSNLFTQLANENNIAIYPYSEGFFVTINTINNETRDKLFDHLVKQHVYICKVNKGLRVAICSIPTSLIYELVKRIVLAYKEL